MLEVGRRVGLEAISYIVLVLGIFSDYISTVTVVARPNIYETNPIAAQLMTSKLWLPANLVVITLGIAIPYMTIRLTRNESFRAILAYPVAHGLIRLSACIWNISLII